MLNDQTAGRPTQSTKLAPGQMLLIPRIVWACMLISIGVYGIALSMMVSQAMPEEAVSHFLQHNLFIPLAAAAFGSLCMSIVLPKILAQRVTRITAPSERQGLGLPYFAPFVIRLALIESVAIYGLVLGFITHNMSPFYLFGAVAMGIMLANYPKNEYFGFM